MVIVDDDAPDAAPVAAKPWDAAAKVAYAADMQSLVRAVGNFGEESHGFGQKPKVPSLLARKREPNASRISVYEDAFIMVSMTDAFCLVNGCTTRPIRCSVNKNKDNEATSTKFDAVIVHMETKHPEFIAADSASFNPRPHAAGGLQVSMLAASAVAQKRRLVTETDRLAKAAVNLLVARPELSFRFVSGSDMEAFVREVMSNTLVDWPGRTKIVNTLEETFNVYRELWKGEMKDYAPYPEMPDARGARAAMTVDGWSNPGKAPFLAITSTTVTSNFRMANVLLDLVRFPHPHSADKHATLVDATIKEWSINAGVITTDGGSNVKKAFGSRAWFYCMGHGFTVMFNHVKLMPKPATTAAGTAVVKKRKAKKAAADTVDAANKIAAVADAEEAHDKAVKEAGKSYEEIKQVLDAKKADRLSKTGKVLRAAAALNNALTIGSSRTQYIKTLALATQPAGKRCTLIPVYEARWWHETLALERMAEMLPTLKKVDFRNPLFTFSRIELRDRMEQLRDLVCNTYLPALNKILPLYRRFADWTARLSCRRSPTVSLVLYAILDLTGCVDFHLKKLVRDEKPGGVATPLEETMMEEFYAAFLKAYNMKEFRAYDYLRWAAVLDPRVVLYFEKDAMIWLEELFEYAEEYVSGWLSDADLRAPAQTAAATTVTDVTENVFANTTEGNLPPVATKATTPWRSEKSIYIGHLAKLKKGDEPGQCLTMDPLEFWESIAPTVPRLARAARDLLATQATSVFSESVFSTAGMIFSKRRGQLAGERGASLVLLNNWSKAEKAVSGPRVPSAKLPKLWTELVASEAIDVGGLVDLDAFEAAAQDVVTEAAEAHIAAAPDDGVAGNAAVLAFEAAADDEAERALGEDDD